MLRNMSIPRSIVYTNIVYLSCSMCYDIKAYSQDVARDIGYTTTALPLHSDYVFTSSPPAVNSYFALETYN